MPDPYKRLKRQLERKRHLGRIRSVHTGELPDIAYHEYSDERGGLDLMLKTQLDWMPGKTEFMPKHGG
jgi:hypothetical protein